MLVDHLWPITLEGIELSQITTSIRNYDLKSGDALLRYRPDIDGLRAVAVLLVLVFHFSLIPTINAGFLGVDIFFVISGFLIADILGKQLTVGNFNLSSFYLRRIRRLAPALFVVLLLSLAVGSVFLFPSELVDLARQVLWSQLYVANIFYWRNINYFGLQAHDVFLLHTWSLAVEEQFYLFFPAFLLLIFRYIKNGFLFSIFLAILISFGLNILIVAQKPEAAFYLLPTRAWEMLLGALIPTITRHLSDNARRDEFLGLLGAAMIAAAATCYTADLRVPGFYALLPTIGASFILISGRHGGTLISKSLSWSPIVYVGKISYPLYLMPWPIHVFASRMFPEYTIEWRLLMFAMSGIMAAAIYHMVEEPISVVAPQRSDMFSRFKREAMNSRGER